MTIILRTLKSLGPDLATATIEFDSKNYLIRGPSETGKSYIRDCLWYLLGGDKPPKPIPLAEGYQELRLSFEAGQIEYEVRRGLSGGSAALYRRIVGQLDEQSFEYVDRDIGELLVELSGARGKLILRSTSEKGPVTGDDMRHWSLLSQTAILSEDPSSGAGFGAPKRIASFNLYLSGNDDTAVQLRKSSAEVERIKGQLSSAETAYKRIQSGLPPEATRGDVSDALAHVDEVLGNMVGQYDARASMLREIRKNIAQTSSSLAKLDAEQNLSASIVNRFELLERKYSNDLQRLGATGEGVTFFQELPDVDCPLCGTTTERQADPKNLLPEVAEKYRKAIFAEAEKIRSLRDGLLDSLERERGRLYEFSQRSIVEEEKLKVLQATEENILDRARTEFSADPKTLAIRRSELSSQLAIFDEMERLVAEIERLKKQKVRPRIQINRDGGTAGREVADLSRDMLVAWGFNDINNISLDAEQCDLIINDRLRLSYGAGRRALYLTALIIALMEHALEKGYPHLGVVVIDSPLKAYADPNSDESKEISLRTVTDKFYEWLSKRAGKGQVIVLENEKIRPETAMNLKTIEFSGIEDVGRYGFYPSRHDTSSDPDKVDEGTSDTQE